MQRRTYRLAIAATGEYTALFRDAGDTDADAIEKTLAAITTMVSYLDAIYGRELAVHFELIDQEASIIFPDGNTDPYTNGDTVQMREENQQTLDAVIGRDVDGKRKYDIGHVFGTNSGGQGSPIGQVCSNERAKGATGGADPRNPNHVLLVAHEFGHQFGADHTFNGSAPFPNGKPDCEPNRTAGAAYEPGSGSTIMSYGGGCGAQDLQPNRDDYFHAKSLEQILAHINGSGSSCITPALTENRPPSVIAGYPVTIPKLTPFTLTAAGSDPDGDTVSYCWEEYDLGTMSGPNPPDTDADAERPIFRSLYPSYTPSRTFPSPNYIRFSANNPPATYTVGGTDYMTGESLPSIERTMTFRVTARDNRPGVGGVVTATKLVRVDGNSGPFSVTSPNSDGSWEIGRQKTVTWDVANTNGAPVNCGSVRILLSTNSGFSFDTVLLDSTPNDGHADVTVPDLPTSSARIKVEAVGNVFFDISDNDFTICNTAPAYITSQPADQTVCTGAPVSFSVEASGSNLWYQWRRNGAAISGANASVLSLGGVNSTQAGSYDVEIRTSCGGSGSLIYSRAATLVVNPPLAITNQPLSTVVCAGQPASFNVAASGEGLRYQWRKNGIPLVGETYSSLVIQAAGTSNAGDYDVVVSNPCNRSVISAKATLGVKTPAVITSQPQSAEICFAQPVTFSVAATGTQLRYQWRKNGVDIAGETRSSYTIASINTASAGNYSVVVSNDCNTVVSLNAQLTVISSPAIVSQPVSATRCPGQSVIFSVTATGTNLRYQWRKNGGNIPGQIGNTLILPSISTGDAGIYSVLVYNGCNTLASGNATLTVSTATSFSLSPTSQNFPANGGSGSVAVSGCGGWAALSNIPWITVTGGSGPGYGTVTYAVAANPSTAFRSGTLTIAGKTFTVTQQGATPSNEADFVIQTPPPTTMIAGQRYNVSIKMRNSGTATWTAAGGYQLQAQRPADSTTWGISRVALPVSVAPGSEVTFNFTITAPATTASYVYEWRMAQNGIGFGSFSPALPVTVTR